MSIKSQETNMRRLADLLSQDLSYIYGDKECGPNGAKRTFLNLGKTFLRALAKDLGLRDAKIKSNAAGIAVSGECTLIGMWGESGIYICLDQPCYDRERVLLYRAVRHINDYKGGHNNFLRLSDLRSMSYERFLDCLQSLNKEAEYDLAA